MWNVDDKSTFLSVDSGDYRVNYIGPGKSYYDSAAIRVDKPIPPQYDLFYFEVTIVSKGQNGIIGIGFCTETANLNLMPGWENESWGYHCDDGKLYHRSGIIELYGCLNFRQNLVYYTKNGVHLGIAFRDFKKMKHNLERGGEHEIDFLLEEEREKAKWKEEHIELVERIKAAFRKGIHQRDRKISKIDEQEVEENFAIVAERLDLSMIKKAQA
ncbi:27892_t:CDS:2, partial [Dentiscutata erythropus]